MWKHFAACEVNDLSVLPDWPSADELPTVLQVDTTQHKQSLLCCGFFMAP